ncbi:MAG: hypothetical protein RIQ89_2321 [Bacteroidota bacterium]|jgi:hypothetical protein
MSNIDIQNSLHQFGTITFSNGSKDQGIVIAKYNLTSSAIEYFFIAASQLENYKQAIEKHDHSTAQNLRQAVAIENISQITH